MINIISVLDYNSPHLTYLYSTFMLSFVLFCTFIFSLTVEYYSNLSKSMPLYNQGNYLPLFLAITVMDSCPLLYWISFEFLPSMFESIIKWLLLYTPYLLLLQKVHLVKSANLYPTSQKAIYQNPRVEIGVGLIELLVIHSLCFISRSSFEFFMLFL